MHGLWILQEVLSIFDQFKVFKEYIHGEIECRGLRRERGKSIMKFQL